MRKVHAFELFGNQYRVKEFAATEGVEILCETDQHTIHPIAMLRHCEVWNGDEWAPLKDRESINALVTDAVKMSTPMQVLEAIILKIYHVNFEFLSSWKPVKIPKRLMTGLPTDIEPARVDPVISLIVMADKATMKELEEYYSTADAFKIYDMIAVENLNKALGAEAAAAEAKKSIRR
jgi:hypothetical protein